jgi:predicted amidohydrolase
VSTDLTFGSATRGPVFDMTTTMSKLLHFGMALDDIVLRATAGPAKILGLEGIAGTLQLPAAKSSNSARRSRGWTRPASLSDTKT